MTEQERINVLLDYLRVLGELAAAGIKVYGEIQRTNEKLERLLD